MASSRRRQVGLVLGLGLLAATAACEQREPAPSIGQSAQETAPAPVTSLITVTTPPVVVPAGSVDDCVVFVQFAAYVGVDDMVSMWDAAGHDATRLRENCTSLGRGDPAALAEISRRRHELDAFLGVTTTAQPSTT